LKEVREGDDPAAVGTLVHGVLFELFKPRLGGIVRRGDIADEELRACFERLLAASGLRENLPFDSLAMLEIAGIAHLSRFLEQQPEETRVLALEREFVREFDTPGGRRILKGTVDRLDLRDGVWVLDYKTGVLPAPDSGVWQDDAFWRRLETWEGGAAGDPLPELAERVPDIQLPCYALLCAHTELAPAGVFCNAAWVDLRDTGEEYPLFAGNAAEMDRSELLRRAALLIHTLVRHMEGASAFSPREGKHCEWCSYAGLCLR
jgi:hypothetical protein